MTHGFDGALTFSPKTQDTARDLWARLSKTVNRFGGAEVCGLVVVGFEVSGARVRDLERRGAKRKSGAMIRNDGLTPVTARRRWSANCRWMMIALFCRVRTRGAPHA
jgi:hypothetical protein